MSAPDAELGHVSAQDHCRRVAAYAVGMIVLLVLFSLGGDNGVVYTVSLLGVPIVSGILAGLGIIRFWHAMLGCLTVVVFDVILDETAQRTPRSSSCSRSSWWASPRWRVGSPAG